jgi:ubiquitin-protein ligase
MAKANQKSTLLSRIQKELYEINLEPPCNCKAAPKGDNLLEWVATIEGPPGSPYEGFLYFLDITFPLEYPFRPPKVRFRTRIYHCNINKKGEICLDILKDKWSPVLKISKVLLSICALLDCPNPDDPLMPAIAQQLKLNPEAYKREAQEWARRFAEPLKQRPLSNDTNKSTNQSMAISIRNDNSYNNTTTNNNNNVIISNSNNDKECQKHNHHVDNNHIISHSTLCDTNAVASPNSESSMSSPSPQKELLGTQNNTTCSTPNRFSQ